MDRTPLARELACYRAHRDELLQDAPGQFVLIKDDAIIGTFAVEDDALEQGYAQFGNVAFLVKRVTENETVVNFTSLTVSY